MPPKTASDSKEEVKNEEENANVVNSMKKLQVITQTREDSTKKEFKFWNNQPVPKLDEKIDVNEVAGPIDPIKTIEDIQKEPYRLAEGFEWDETNVDDPEVINEIYTLLNENYVEDDDNMFRFDYSIPFLKWALKPPGWLKQWHIGVRASKNKKLVAFITGIPSTIAIYDKSIRMVEINFLCIHKRLRDKRLAPILIKEITRRVNLTGIFQAVYTAGKVLPKPVARCRYYHRSLNPKKLIDVGFSHLQPRMTLPRTIKLYKLPDEPEIRGIRELQKKDIPSATKLVNKYLEKFSLKSVFDEHEFEHWFLPIDGVVNTYVVADPKTNEITDIASFYTLPSTIIGHPNYKTLKAAYSFYNIANTVSLTALMKDTLIFAKKNFFDVFNCLDIMENESFLKDLKFGKGDGNLQYYLFNWRCQEMEPPKVGLVLL